MNRLSIPVTEQDHAQGPADAAVTMVEYGDYECPYCGEAYPVLKAVQKAMGDDLRFVFRNFPLAELHPHAMRAAEFAETAGGQGVFWQAHDLLFENQMALSEDDLHRYAKLLEIPPLAVARGLAGRFDRRIEDDFRGGLRSGVNGTPTLFINGLRYNGPRDAETLVAVLQELLQQTGRPAMDREA